MLAADRPQRLPRCRIEHWATGRYGVTPELAKPLLRRRMGREEAQGLRAIGAGEILEQAGETLGRHAGCGEKPDGVAVGFTLGLSRIGEPRQERGRRCEV